LPQDQLDLILRRHAEILARLAGAPEASAYVALSRELAGIEAVAKAFRIFAGKPRKPKDSRPWLANPAPKRAARPCREE